MSSRILSLRELNRATLARQLLLTRAAMMPHDAIAEILGLQAQVAAPPFIGLWTRLDGFARADLEDRLSSRRESIRLDIDQFGHYRVSASSRST